MSPARTHHPLGPLPVASPSSASHLGREIAVPTSGSAHEAPRSLTCRYLETSAPRRPALLPQQWRGRKPARDFLTPPRLWAGPERSGFRLLPSCLAGEWEWERDSLGCACSQQWPWVGMWRGHPGFANSQPAGSARLGSAGRRPVPLRPRDGGGRGPGQGKS